MKQWNFYTTNEIKPKGWLLRQLEIQAKGLSGNLDKIWPDIRDSAWIGGSREGWERVPYWLDGYIPLAYLLEDEAMISTVKRYIDAILSAQKEDGWICPCEDDARQGYDTWAVQLITKVLVVYYECSKDARIPGVVYKILKNYYELLKSGAIRLFSWGAFRWFEACIAIRFVYDLYREDWLPELARLLKEQGVDYRDFEQMWKRPLYRWQLQTHIVNLTMMLKAEAVSCDLLGEAYCNRAEHLRKVLEQYNGTVYESFTGDECLAGISPIQGTELCAIVEQMYSYELLYAYTGDRQWAERLEILAFNALPAALSEDMWTHQYVQMSNQMSCERFPGKPIFTTNDAEAHMFGLEPNYGCCTANFNQGWPKLALSAFLHKGNTVLHSLLLPCELRSEGKHIVAQTDYPFKNRVKYTIEAETDFDFLVRIPSFAKNIRVNGEAVRSEDLSFPIKAGTDTELEVTFETEVSLEKRPGGLNVVKYGSLLFCVPIGYEKVMHEYTKKNVERKYPYCDYELLPLDKWNYAYCAAVFPVSHHAVADIPYSAEHPPVAIRAKVMEIDWGLEDGYEHLCAKYPRSLIPLSKEKEIDLIPYGCAKLRMTELPFITSKLYPFPRLYT